MTETRPKILLVDDEIPLREAIAHALETMGYEVVELGDAESALDRAAAEKFDAAILDNNLPGMMGITALPRILKLVSPVVMITGHSAEEVRRDALLLGAKCLLEKPMDLDALAAALGRVEA